MLLWINKDKPDAEGSEKKKETETETEAVSHLEVCVLRRPSPLILG